MLNKLSLKSIYRFTIACLALFFLKMDLSFAQGYFKNVTEYSNVKHAHVAPNLMGGGIAIIDFDNDGFEDIYLTGGVYEDHLFKNNGNKTFTDVTDLSGIFDATRTVHTMGAISGDINSDGYEDLFIPTESGERNILFLNNHGESFENIALDAGLGSKSWSMGAAFGDYNLDGNLDLYVINYIKRPSAILDENNEVIGFDHDCYPNQFYINNGDNTFKEVAEELNIANKGCGLAVAFTDANGDGLPDIYIANDFGEWLQPNTYFQNNHPNSGFLDRSRESNLDVQLYGMGIGVGDTNNDGLLDYYVTNLGKNAMMQQNQAGSFDNVTDQNGLANAMTFNHNSTGWGTEIFDYDHDGYEDLFVSNGYIGAAQFLNTTQNDPNKLFKNNGDGSFSDVSELEGLDDYSIGRGVVTFDYDNDGDLDLVVSSIYSVRQSEDGVQILENIKGNNKNWLKVKLKAQDTNPNGIGARVICYFDDKIWIDEISGGSSHASKRSNFAHFGLGSISVLDSLVVVWPGGNRSIYTGVQTNQFILIGENSDLVEVIGCTDVDDPNYNPDATYNTGCLLKPSVTSFEDNNIRPYKVYPNPARGKLVVRTRKDNWLKLQIRDLNGHEIFQQRAWSLLEVDISAVDSGIYFLIINDSYNQKLIIK